MSTHYASISAKQPLILNSLGAFRFSATMDVEENPVVAGTYQINGDRGRRGAIYHSGTDSQPVAVLLRGNGYGIQSTASKFNVFPAANQSTLGINAPDVIHTIHNIDGVFWVLGQVSGSPSIEAKAALGSLSTAPAGWTNRSADASAVLALSHAMFMRKARDAGFLYYILWDSNTSNMNIMRGTGSGSAFSLVTTSPLSSTPRAYAVRDDGQTHLIGATTTEYRSADGGATWTAISIGIDGVTDIQYCKAHGTWVATAPTTGGTPGVRYSTNDAVSWADARLRGGSAGAGTLARFTHIEKIDAEGRYLLGIRDYNPIQYFISEDGGLTWLFAGNVDNPWYDPNYRPSNSQLILLNTGSKIMLYQGATAGGNPEWNFDNSMFESGLVGIDITLT